MLVKKIVIVRIKSILFPLLYHISQKNYKYLRSKSPVRSTKLYGLQNIHVKVVDFDIFCSQDRANVIPIDFHLFFQSYQ